MKGIEFILLAVGAILGAYIRYKITSFPLILGIIGSNVLIVNIIGSFILGIFSVLLVNWNLDQRYSFLIAIGFCGSLHYHVFICSRKYSNDRKQTNSKHDDQYYSKCRLFLFGPVWRR